MTAKLPIDPARVTVTPGTSSSNEPRSSYARGLASGRTTDAAATWSSRGAAA